MRNFLIHVAVILLLVSTAGYAEDGIYSLKASKPTGLKVDGADLVVRMPLEKVDPPKAKKIILFESEGAFEGGYMIQIDLENDCEEPLRPVLVLGEHTLVEGISVGGSEELGFSITLGSDDLATARDWISRLANLFELPKEKVIDFTGKSQTQGSD